MRKLPTNIKHATIRMFIVVVEKTQLETSSIHDREMDKSNCGTSLLKTATLWWKKKGGGIFTHADTETVQDILSENSKAHNSMYR